jgi:hypothetical protein
MSQGRRFCEVIFDILAAMSNELYIFRILWKTHRHTFMTQGKGAKCFARSRVLKSWKVAVHLGYGT